MVKQITHFNTTYKIGSISINVDDLIDILERRGFKRVTARTNDHEFESLSDIKQHKSLLAGSPDLNTDGISLSFNRFGSYLRIYGEDPDLVVKLQTMLKDFQAKRTLFDVILQNSYKLFAISLVIYWAMQIYQWKYPQNITEYFTIIFYIVNAAFILSLPIYIYSSIRQPVRLKPNGPFGKYAGQIMIGLIVAIGSGVILKKFFGV